VAREEDLGERVTVADSVAFQLRAAGVRHVCCMAGGYIAPFLDSARTAGLSVVPFQHEQGAAFAADAIGRMGGLGVAAATGGPGALNLLPGIASAYYDSSPTLFIVGTPPARDLRSNGRQLGFQEAPIIWMATPITKKVLDRGAQNVIASACRLVRRNRPGPVLLDIPFDLQLAQLEEGHVDVEELPSSGAFELDKLFGMTFRAQRPVILAGGGIRSAGAVELFRKFVDLQQIPVVHSLMAVDVLPAGHRFRAGMIGAYGSFVAKKLLSRADTVIVLGSRLDSRQQAPLQGKNVFRVDVDKKELLTSPYDTCVHADLRLWLKAAVQESVQQVETRVPQCAPATDAVSVFLREVSRANRDAVAFVVDVGQNQMQAAHGLELSPHQRFLTSGGLGAMGWALPAGIGVALETGGPVVVITGDGGMQVNIQELETLSRLGLPVRIIVLDNGELGMVRQFQDENFGGRHVATVEGYSAPDFVRVAGAYGLAHGRCFLGEDWGLRWLPMQCGPALLRVCFGATDLVWKEKR